MWFLFFVPSLLNGNFDQLMDSRDDQNGVVATGDGQKKTGGRSEKKQLPSRRNRESKGPWNESNS